MTEYLGRTLDDALAYAEKQRKELPLIVQVVPHDYDRIIMAEEIARLKSLVEVAGVIFRHNLTPDKGFNYFICGEGGSKDKNGLPEKLFLCPAYGVDWFQTYERTNDTARKIVNFLKEENHIDYDALKEHYLGEEDET